MRVSVRRLGFGIPIVLGMACGGAPPEPLPANFGLRTGVWAPDSTSLLAREYYSGIEESVDQVIDDARTFDLVWARLYANRQPVPPRPAVDFERERVVLVAMGQRSSGGYGISIDSIVEFEHGSVVHTTAFAPGNGCVVTLALTQPVEVVRIASPPTGPVAFVQRQVAHHCE